MHDYLSKYQLSTDEREWLLMTVLKRLCGIGKEPHWLHKRRNFVTWNKIKRLYGEDCVRDTLHTLREKGLTTTEGNLIVATERGRAVRKRGWVETKINKFNYNVWTTVISIIAIAVSFFNGTYTWKFIKWVLQVFAELSSRYL